MQNLEYITLQMNRLEETIAGEQKYISQWGEHNDKNPDEQWEQFKQDAQSNLDRWDYLKAKRDAIKARLT